MGLLDNFSFDNLDDPNKQALLAMGLSMLAPKQTKTSVLGDVGSSGLAGLQTLINAKTQERANRQNDIQQLTAASQIIRQHEFARMAQAQQSGQPYTPNPLGSQIDARLSQLITGPNLSKILGSAASASPAPPQAPPSAPAVPSGMAPPSQSPMASPDYNPVPAAVRAPAPPQAQANASGLPPGFGGPAGGIPMSVWAASDPTGMAYLKQLAEDNKPVALRQGDLVGRGPDGNYRSLFQQPQSVPGVLPSRDPSGQVTSFRQGPGFKEAAADIKGAETGAVASAEDPHTMIAVTLGDGRVVQVPRSSLMGKPTAAGLPFVSPQTPQGAPKVAQVTVTDPSKQAQGPADPWVTMPKVVAATGMGQSTSQKVIDQKRADMIGTLSDKFNGDSDVAAQRIAMNTQARALVDNADTGWLASHIGQFRNVLGTLGVQSAADKGATDQVLAKDLVQTAVTRGKQLFGSRFTQSEVGLMLNKGSASPEMQSAAIKFLIDTDNAGQQYNIQRGQDFHKYVSQGGDALAFVPWYSQSFPLTKQLETIAPPGQGAPAAGGVRRYNPKTGRIE